MKPEWRSELRDGGIKAAALDRRVEREKGGEPVPGATQRKALPDPQNAEEVQRPGADLRVAGQKGDRHGGEAEQEQRDGQFDPAPVAAVDGREDDGADRPRHEGEREDGEGVERRRHGFREREEHLREHHHGRDGEYEEIEILRRSADDDADGDLARRNLVVGGYQASVALQRRGGGQRPFDVINRHRKILYFRGQVV